VPVSADRTEVAALPEAINAFLNSATIQQLAKLRRIAKEQFQNKLSELLEESGDQATAARNGKRKGKS
jgi:hypothetical protein